MTGSFDLYRGIASWGLASSILLLVFAASLRVSMVTISLKLNGNGVGKTASLLGLVTAVIGVAYYSLTLLGIAVSPIGGGFYYYPNALGWLMMIALSVFLGGTLVLLGVFFLLYREYSTDSELWLATGIVYIIAGAYQFGSLSYIVGSAAAVLTGAMGATCYLKRK